MYKALAIVVSAAVAALIGGSPVAAAAAPPPNDKFSLATPIAYLPFEAAHVNNWAATLDKNEFDPSCSSVDSTIWYKIVPSSDYTLRVRATPDTEIDVVIAVYNGTSYGSLAEQACADTFGQSGEELVRVDLLGGNTYYIQVGGNYYGGATGEFTVKARREPPPANDNFVNAATAPLGSISNAMTYGATTQTGELNACAGYKTVWYRYTPTTTRTIIGSTSGSSFDTVLAVYVGSSLDSLDLVTCNDDQPASLTSKLKLKVYAGTTYYFQVGGYNGHSGELVFTLKKA